KDHVVQVELSAGGIGIELIGVGNQGALEHTGELIEELAGGGSDGGEGHIAEGRISICLVGIGNDVRNGVGAVAEAHAVGSDGGGFSVKVNGNRTSNGLPSGAVSSE